MTNQKEALDDAFSCAKAALRGPLPLGALSAILETLRARVDAALSSQPPAPREAEERAAFEAWASTEWANGRVPDNAWLGWLARASLTATAWSTP